jgi:hypothetical protein
MHRRARTALVTAAAACTLLAGCTTQIPGVPAPASPGSAPVAPAPGPAETDPVAWMGKVCTALLPAIEAMSERPALNSSNPATAVAGISSFLAKSSTAVDGAITGMAAAGPSPIEGGDEAVAALTETLTSFRDTAREAKTKIDAIDTSDPRALATGLPAAVEPLEKLADLPNPAAELESNPELDRAAAQAPSCQKVETAIN